VTITTRTTDLAFVDLEFSDAERYALAAFLAGYRGLTSARSVQAEASSAYLQSIGRPSCRGGRFGTAGT
jgi:hypothetical protein